MDLWLLIAITGGLVVVIVAAMWLVTYLRYRRPDAGRDDLVRAGRTRDGRGRVVKLLDPMPLYTLSRYDTIDRESLLPIVEELEPGASRKRPLLFVSLGTCVLVFAGLGVMLAIEGRPAWTDVISTLTNPAILAGIISGAVAPWATARHARHRKLARVMLRHRRCPHCGYGLTGVPPDEDDGLTVCPECWCAWPLADSGGAAPAAQATPRAALWTLLAIGLGAALAGGLVLFMLMR